jgi:predicted transcriptional regulator of viral defense system
MRTRTSFDIAKKDIVSFFNQRTSRVYTFNEISEILGENKQFWRLPSNFGTKQFIKSLIAKAQLQEFDFVFPKITIKRYTWGEVSLFGLISTLKPEGYLSHYSAMYLHDLTEQVPKAFYLNFEQQEKPATDSKLQQVNIDRAFSRPPRVTNNIAKFGDYTVHLLNGKYTGGLGVVEVSHSEQEKVRATNVERTLIDIAVRPSYSGGVYEVLKAYRRASERVSINKLVSMLTKLDYTYPYHQAIGFYLEKTGVYRESQIRLLEKLNMEFDFYLTHQMKDPEYSKKWKIYYPKGL